MGTVLAVVPGTHAFAFAQPRDFDCGRGGGIGGMLFLAVGGVAFASSARDCGLGVAGVIRFTLELSSELDATASSEKSASESGIATASSRGFGCGCGIATASYSKAT